MQVEQKNLWDNVTRSLSDDATAKGIAAYQANVAEYSKSTAIQQEHFEKTVGVSDSGTIDMATYENREQIVPQRRRLNSIKKRPPMLGRMRLPCWRIQLQPQIIRRWRRMDFPLTIQTATRS